MLECKEVLIKKKKKTVCLHPLESSQMLRNTGTKQVLMQQERSRDARRAYKRVTDLFGQSREASKIFF
jgi:hypothetical protein